FVGPGCTGPLEIWADMRRRAETIPHLRVGHSDGDAGFVARCDRIATCGMGRRHKARECSGQQPPEDAKRERGCHGVFFAFETSTERERVTLDPRIEKL